MDSQGGSVRRNIALKLRGDQTSAQKVQQPELKRGLSGILIGAHQYSVHVCLNSDDSITSVHSISEKAPPTTSSIASSSKKSSINVVLRSGEDLQWDQKIHLVGRCVKDPAMHICESCSLPVLIYGRMVSSVFYYSGQILQSLDVHDVFEA